MCIYIIFNMVEWQQISADLFKVNNTESQSTFSMACYICLCTHVFVWTSASAPTLCTCTHAFVSLCVCGFKFEALLTRPFALLSPRGAVSLPVGMGFPCVTMITFTSTIKSRRTQITVTQWETPPAPLLPCLDLDEIWRQDLLSSAQPQLKAGTHNNLWELRSSLC